MRSANNKSIYYKQYYICICKINNINSLNQCFKKSHNNRTYYKRKIPWPCDPLHFKSTRDSHQSEEMEFRKQKIIVPLVSYIFFYKISNKINLQKKKVYLCSQFKITGFMITVAEVSRSHCICIQEEEGWLLLLNFTVHSVDASSQKGAIHSWPPPQTI